MAKIIVKKKAQVFKDFTLPIDKSIITIGSETDNDLVINDKKISMNHLKIIRKGDSYFVEDLNSAFGTIVDGKSVQGRMEITNGDEIKLGQHTLIFLNEQNFSKENSSQNFLSEDNSLNSDTFEISELDITSEIEDDTNSYENIEVTSLKHDSDNNKSSIITERPQLAEPGKRSSAKVSKWPQIPYYLLAIYGPYRGKKYQLNKGETKIGRDTKLNDIIIRQNPKGDIDSSISRRHTKISLKDDGFYISDKRSKTRTYVNQDKLTESDFIKLVPGDEIEIVSDQKSTIFRLTVEGDWDFSSPKKAGVWWVRYWNPAFKIISTLILLFSVIMLVMATKSRHIISQRPDPLLLTEKIWSQSSSQKNQNEFLQATADAITAPSPVVGDLNGDSILDVIFLDRHGILHVIDGATKGPLWHKEYPIYVNKACPPALADLNGNGLVDIILFSRTSRLQALDGMTGAEIWRSQILGGTFTGRPTISDVNGDKLLDVAIGTIEGKVLIAYGRTTEPRWLVIETNDSLRSTISAGDVDGDGIDNFIFGTENGFIIIIDGLKGQIKRRLDINEEVAKAKDSSNEFNPIRAPVGIGYFNNDKYLDLVTSTNQGNLLAIDGKTRKRFWHDVLLSQDDLISDFYFPTVIGDLNGDKLHDIVIFTLDGTVKAYQGAGNSGTRKTVLWEYIPEDWEKFIANPVLCDFNKDGILDVIASGINNGLYVIDGFNGKLLWGSKFQGQNPPISSPLVADLEGDSYLDILLLRADYTLYMYKSNARFPKSALLWGQQYHNARNTGGAITPTLHSTAPYNIKIIFSLLLISIVVGLNALSVMRQKKLVQNLST